MGEKRFVAYYRVSSQRQGQSGLGLEAQTKAVMEYLADGKKGRCIAAFQEVESGRQQANRPKLQEAMRECRLRKATLLVAKLDRLARNVAFISNLMEAGVPFVAVDFPEANEFTLHILSAVAQHETRMASIRTKAALAAAKARGVQLGGDRGNLRRDSKKGRVRSAEVRRQQVRDRNEVLGPFVQSLRAKGETLQGIADKLNAKGDEYPAARGGAWSPTQVRRIALWQATEDQREARAA